MKRSILRLVGTFQLSAAMLLGWQMAVASPALANPSEGVNAADLAWSPPATRQKVLQEIAQSGFKSVRLAFVPPFDASVAMIQEARNAGLTVLLNVNLSYPQYNPPGIPVRSGENKLNQAHGLSYLDPVYFRKMFTPIWNQIEAQHLQIFAIEVGNEINWADYNGDLAVRTAPGAKPITSLAQLPERSAFVKGLKAYVETVAVIDDLRDKSSVNKSMKVLTAGLATVPQSADIRKYADYVSPQETIDQLRALGVDKLVDGYAVHFYPGLSPDQVKQASDVATTLAVCSSAKPCWLTEWGMANKTTTCPDPDAQRVAAIGAFTQVLKNSAGTHPVETAYYFDFDSTRMPYSVWRCNGLSPAGQAVIHSQ